MPPEPAVEPAVADDEARAWSALLAASRWDGESPRTGTRFVTGANGRLEDARRADRYPALTWSPVHGWRHDGRWPAHGAALLDLYLPLCSARTRRRTLTVGHLGQSLDGHIAMDSGDSCYVTGPANITHLHRMRALCDAVVVGAETVARDDPRLTTRQVRGEHAVRVVLDPGRRLESTHRLFSDGQAPTIVVCAGDRNLADASLGQAEVIGVAARGGRLDLAAVLDVLHRRGLRSVFVEGGGITVSTMLSAGLLDRLHVAIAPLIIGAGRPGLRLPAPASLDQCPRPPARIFRMGADILFDCDLRAPPEADAAPGATVERVL